MNVHFTRFRWVLTLPFDARRNVAATVSVNWRFFLYEVVWLPTGKERDIVLWEDAEGCVDTCCVAAFVLVALWSPAELGMRV